MPSYDWERPLQDLKELAELTGGPDGARRLAWSEDWRTARKWLLGKLEETDATVERDVAGNLWATIPGASDKIVVVGSHIDAVPNGGWLDGCLGLLAAVEVLRAHAGETPQVTLKLVDWADEEGARFGRSLFGSSAFSGSLDPEGVRGLRDAEGISIVDALAENGVDLGDALGATSRQDRIAAYLELHIEQGPVLEAEGVQAAAVSGCAGVQRHRFRFRGQSSHAGTTPMDRRRDAGLAAAQVALRVEEVGAQHGGMATTGSIVLFPGIPTAVAGEAELLVDLRHPDAGELAAMLADARAAAEAAASRRGCEFEAESVWAIEPIPFDAELVAMASDACREAADSDRVLASGALHDAAEVARVAPTAMVFCPSIGGISHASEEDTAEPDLIAAIEAFGLLANRVLST